MIRNDGSAVMTSAMMKSHMKILHVIRSTDPDQGGPIEGLRRHVEARNRLGLAETTVASFGDTVDRHPVAGATMLNLGNGIGCLWI